MPSVVVYIVLVSWIVSTAELAGFHHKLRSFNKFLVSRAISGTISEGSKSRYRLAWL